jgi:transposase InsO family protein
VHELRQLYPVVALLKTVGLSRSTFYAWDKARKAPDKYALVKELIQQIFDEHYGRYGYRRIACALQNRGIDLHENTVRRLMVKLGLKSTQRPKRYKSYKGECGVVAPDLLERDFNAAAPNTKWVTDVTEFKVGDEKLFLSPVKDLFNGEIVAYEMSSRPTLDLVTNMLKKAFGKLKKGQRPIVHSDQGWQYQMSVYRKMLKKRKLRPSMSRKGNCLDNASMESFFAVLKTECFHKHKFADIDALKATVHKYIQYYNTIRITTGLGGLTPVQYRAKHAQAN